MRRLVWDLVTNEDEGYYIITNKQLVKNLLQSAAEQFKTKKDLAKTLGIDESGLYRWIRQGILPISALKKIETYPGTKRFVKAMKEPCYLCVPKSPHKVKLPRLNADIAYLVSYVSGDGHIKDQVKNNNKWEIIVESWVETPELLRQLQEIMAAQFNMSTSLCKNKTRKGYRLFINSKILHKILNKVFEIPIGNKHNEVQVPQIIRQASDKIRKSYIRGWFDAEGFVTTSHKKPQIGFYVKNKHVTSWIKNQLENFGMKVSKKKSGELNISSKNSIILFCKIIGFRHPKQLKKLLQAR